MKKKVEVWRSTRNHPALPSNTIIFYRSDRWLLFLFLLPVLFILTTCLLWIINISWYPRPPAPDFLSPSNPIQHIIYWFAVFVNHAFPFIFKESSAVYLTYTAKLIEINLLYILISRIAIAFGVSLLAFPMSKSLVHRYMGVPAVREVHKEGTELLVGEEAEADYARKTASELARTGAFCKIGDSAMLSVGVAVTHFIVIGMSGSGKSQAIIPAIQASIGEPGQVTIILDPKREFCNTFYKDDGTMALIDPTDARGYMWDWVYDLTNHRLDTISQLRTLASSFMESGGGEGDIWTNGARAMFVGILLFVVKNFKDATFRDIVNCLNLSTEELYYIMQNYYPSAAEYVGLMDKEGNIETNATSYSFKVNLKTASTLVEDLARHWHEPDRRRVSFLRVMFDPKYPIKKVFIVPNDSTKLMSNGIIRAMLNYTISLIDTPLARETKKLKGCFFLDEFHSIGKLLKEDNKTTTLAGLIDRGRSKGFSAWLLMQSLDQGNLVYSEDIMKAWRGSAQNYILTGAGLGETADKAAAMLGKKVIDKYHLNEAFQKDGRTTSGGWQNHVDDVTLSNELIQNLGVASEIEDGKEVLKIRFLMTVGNKGAYIFHRNIVFLQQGKDRYRKQKTNDILVEKDNRVVRTLANLMKMPDPDKAKEFVSVELKAPADESKATTTGINGYVSDSSVEPETYSEYPDPQEEYDLDYKSPPGAIEDIGAILKELD